MVESYCGGLGPTPDGLPHSRALGRSVRVLAWSRNAGCWFRAPGVRWAGTPAAAWEHAEPACAKSGKQRSAVLAQRTVCSLCWWFGGWARLLRTHAFMTSRLPSRLGYLVLCGTVVALAGGCGGNSERKSDAGDAANGTGGDHGGSRAPAGAPHRARAASPAPAGAPRRARAASPAPAGAPHRARAVSPAPRRPTATVEPADRAAASRRTTATRASGATSPTTCAGTATRAPASQDRSGLPTASRPVAATEMCIRVPGLPGFKAWTPTHARVVATR